jgi:hypothetical protein
MSEKVGDCELVCVQCGRLESPFELLVYLSAKDGKESRANLFVSVSISTSPQETACLFLARWGLGDLGLFLDVYMSNSTIDLLFLPISVALANTSGLNTNGSLDLTLGADAVARLICGLVPRVSGALSLPLLGPDMGAEELIGVT